MVENQNPALQGGRQLELMSIDRSSPIAVRGDVKPFSSPQPDHEFIAFLRAVCDEWEAQERAEMELVFNARMMGL